MFKKFALVFLACLFLSLHYGAVLYINSSFLENFFSPSAVSLLFVLGAFGNFGMFFLIPKFIRNLGNRAVTLLMFTGAAVSSFAMAFAQSPFVAATAFVIYASLLYAIFYCLDLFLEEASEDSATGEIRGLWLTIIHVGLISGLIVLSALSDTENIFRPVYIAAGFMLIPAFLIASTCGPGHAARRPNRHTLPFRTWWKAKSLRRATLARFSLELFYSFMTIYTPLYLHTQLGFSFSQIGVMFALALTPFLVLQWPVGRLADLFIGEKEMLIVGLLFIFFSLLFMPSLGAGFAVWTIALFFSRIGASMVETTTDSYFFKHVNSSDVGLLSIFRLARPASIVLGAAAGAVILNFISIEKIFFILAGVVFFGLKEALLIRDTKPIVAINPEVSADKV